MRMLCLGARSPSERARMRREAPTREAPTREAHVGGQEAAAQLAQPAHACSGGSRHEQELEGLRGL
jgi:hypothetical protein